MANKPLLVAAFDFGTTYSGYAFSFSDDPYKVQTFNWVAGTGTLISLKTPTCVLLNPSGKFDSFGYEAEDKYVTLLENEEQRGWRFFRRFKMLLQRTKGLSRETTVKDIDGRSMEAMPLFTMCIKYLKKHLMNAIHLQLDAVKEKDIQYILTVPALWDDSAKQFMREAAMQAGISSAQLKLALESEVASIWCEKVTETARVALAGIGTQYLVIDLGGGTADVSVHERTQGGKLKEIHRASGGPWGGIKVDQNYLITLTEIFGLRAIEDFQKEAKGDYFDLLREFETKKRTFTTGYPQQMTFRIPNTLRRISERLYNTPLEKRIERKEGLRKIVLLKGDKLRLDYQIVKQWFDGPVNHLIDHVNELLAKPKIKAVQTILLVGGFGESKYVQERISKDISGKRLIVPSDAGLVVLKGAVRFGHEPDVVTSRILTYTYGIRAYVPFDPKLHPVEKKVIANGSEKVDEYFAIFAQADESVELNKEVTFNARPCNTQLTKIPVFRSIYQHPTFVTEPGCELLGTITIKHDEVEASEDNTILITLMFGDTELLVKSRLKKSGHEEILRLDCL